MAAHLYNSQFLPFIMGGTPFASNPNAHRDDEGFKKLLRSRAASLSDGKVNEFRNAIGDYVASHSR
jgi:hypothetical protein